VRIPLPHAKDVRDLLEGLLGREVTVRPGEPVVARPASPATVAVFTDRQLTMRAVIAADLALSAGVGTALRLLPARTAVEVVRAGALPATVLENLREVFDVAGGWFNVGDAHLSPHLSLYQIVPAGAMPPVDVSVLLRTLGRRLDLVVTIAGYGSGALSVVARV
jgi:hypothetical protein